MRDAGDKAESKYSCTHFIKLSCPWRVSSEKLIINSAKLLFECFDSFIPYNFSFRILDLRLRIQSSLPLLQPYQNYARLTLCFPSTFSGLLALARNDHTSFYLDKQAVNIAVSFSKCSQKRALSCCYFHSLF